MDQLNLPAIKAQIQELFANVEGTKSAEKYWEATDLNVSLRQRRIEIKGQKITLINGDRDEKEHNVIISNWSYRVPVVDAQGNPVMVQEAFINEQGQEDVRTVQKTIGEADHWLLKFLPLVGPAIVLGALVDLGLLESNPITYQE